MFGNNINRLLAFKKLKYYKISVDKKKKEPTKEDIERATQEYFKKGGKVTVLDCTIREETG